jgi:DNA polymerase-1
LDLKCELCGLCKTAKTVRIEGCGSKSADILVVAGKPSRDDDNRGRLFQDNVGSYLRTILKTASVDVNRCYFTSAVKCYSSSDNESNSESVKVCPANWLAKEIRVLRPKVIVALGNDAYSILTGNKSVDKDRGSLIVKEYGDFSSYIMPIYSPYFLMQQSGQSKNVKQTVEDLRKINSILDGTFGMWSDLDLDNGVLDYQVIDSVEKLQSLVPEIYKAGVLAADIESRKLDPYKVSTHCVGEGFPFVSFQFAFKEKQAFFIPWANAGLVHADNPLGFAFSEEDMDKIKAILKELLEDANDKITLVGHNFKFDSKWIMKWLGIRPKLDYDTMVAASFLGEATNRLKKVAWHWTNMGGYETKQDEFTGTLGSDDKWDMFKYPFPILVPYGCADADATLRIYNQFVKNKVVNPENQLVFDTIIKASRVFMDIENDGIHIDVPYLDQLREDLTLELKKTEEEFRMEAPLDIEFLDKQIYKESLGKKGLPLKHKNTQFLISSNDHIARLFYGRLGMEINDKMRSKKTKDVSTGSPALKELEAKYPIAKKLLEYRRISKQISGFVDAYPEYIDEYGRIHPNYSLVQHENAAGDESGTITGRTSCSDPNLQQVPSRGDGKRIKKLFIPDHPNHLFVDFDFAGIELRVATMHSQDKKMKEFFNSGKGDFHRFAASLIYGIPEEEVSEDPQRRIAKTFNFALLYGAGPGKLAQTAGISLAEAEAFIREYFKNFPSLAEWIRRQHKFVKMNGYVKSMFGRVRYLPDAQLDTRDINNKIKMEAALKRAVNTPVQADASDLTQYSLGRIWDYLNEFKHSDPEHPTRLRGSVHDSILLSVHKEDLPEIATHIKYNILEDPKLDFILEKGVNLRADCKIGPNWGEQTPLNFEGD